METLRIIIISTVIVKTTVARSTTVKRVMRALNMLFWILLLGTVSTDDLTYCSLSVHLARAEQSDANGHKCWDMVKVPTCGGRCDSNEIADWEFPFKKSHHPVCLYGARRPLVVRLRHCDPGVTPGTEMFHFAAAEDCRCKMCSSHHTSCEWLPTNSTLLQALGINNYAEKNEISESNI